MPYIELKNIQTVIFFAIFLNFHTARFLLETVYVILIEF